MKLSIGFFTLNSLALLALAGCGGGSNNNQAAVPTPINPTVACVTGQVCAAGGVVAIASSSVHFAGLVNLSPAAAPLIQQMVNANRYAGGWGWSWSSNSNSINYSIGYLDLQAEAGTQFVGAPGITTGQVIYHVTLVLGASTMNSYNQGVTITADVPLYANGAGSQLQISPTLVAGYSGYSGYPGYSGFGIGAYPGYGYGGGGNSTGHQFNIVSTTPLDGTVPVVNSVQIVIDNQYPVAPAAPFGLVNLSQQLYNNLNTGYGTGYNYGYGI